MRSGLDSSEEVKMYQLSVARRSASRPSGSWFRRALEARGGLSTEYRVHDANLSRAGALSQRRLGLSISASYLGDH